MSSSREIASMVLATALVGTAACVDHKGGVTGTQSLLIEVVTPTDLGTVNARLPDTQRSITINLTARDADNALDTSFEQPVRVYAQFLGTLTPELSRLPLLEIPMTAGAAMGQQFTLPSAFGPTTVWVDNGTGLGADYQHGAIVGTSNTIWYRDPFIADLQTPSDEMAVDALSRTPLSDKQISVSTSRYGANGRVVVTSVFSQGYTASDVSCANAQGAPPCTAQAYDHIMVFTFSAPRDQHRRALQVGRLIERFTGGLSEFNGLTEVGFPRTFAPEGPDEAPVLDLTRVPTPVLFDLAWFGPLSDPNGVINFERNEAGAIEIRGAVVCDLDDDYTTYKQWKLDPAGVGGDCSNKRNVLNLITQGTDFVTDPATLVGRAIPSVTGIVRPVNIGSFNVWIVYPRGGADIVLP